jgi:hypothetical protein
MNLKKPYREPIIPDGASWVIGLFVAVIVFLLTYLTGFLPLWAAASAAFVLVLVIGIGVDVWDVKAYYYHRAYAQMNKAKTLLQEIDENAGRIENKDAVKILRSIVKKVQILFDPEEGKVTPDGTGEQFLSTATAFVIALTTVADGARKYESLEQSFSLDQDGRGTLKAALDQFHTIDEWLDQADKQLHTDDRVGLNALVDQMESYKYRSL